MSKDTGRTGERRTNIMQIGIFSGKGGTGKTTMSLAISHHLHRMGMNVKLGDCDVEEPNIGLFLPWETKEVDKVYMQVPFLNKEKCISCSACDEICQFNAIAMVKGFPLIFPDLCHSCGGCFLACPTSAIEEKPVEIGTLDAGGIDSFDYLGGKLNIGQIQTPTIIKEVKERMGKMKSDILILDCPPGNSCPMLEAVRGCDHMFIVTEPTPFGFNDFVIAVDTLRIMKMEFSVILNKYRDDDNATVKFCKDEGIDIIAMIPDSTELAVQYSKGEFVDFMLENFGDEMGKISHRVDLLIKGENKQ